MVRLLLVNWVSLTNGSNGIVGISYPDFGFFKLTNMTQCYYLAVIFMVLLMAYLKILMKSRVGRCFLEIRDDDKAAEMVGINVSQYKLKAFMISAVYCAIAGVLYAHVIRYISPDSFRADESQLILCCVIIGGIGTYRGTVIGAILLTIIPELCPCTSGFPNGIIQNHPDDDDYFLPRRCCKILGHAGSQDQVHGKAAGKKQLQRNRKSKEVEL
ncbi:MAG: branched-chain amino acid ABC transporter permease [Lachnospiraceae bacterium]